jgi:signal transduction histidine kinase
MGLDSLKKLVLDPYDNNIELSFSVPEFYKKVYYSYRVIGQSEHWTAYKLDSRISLYGLQPGKYTIELKASTGLNDANASFYTLPIEMKQVWFKKSWIIALFSLLAVATIIAFLRFRFSQKIKRQKDLADLRTKISSDLHDDVGTILSGLAMQSQVLTYSANEKQKESLNQISDMSREAMEHMRDTVWAMDSRKDKYENLVDRMRAFAERNLGLKNMTHDFTIKNIDNKKFIDPEKRQAIYLIFKEAITNIIKHSNGNHVSISFTEEKNMTCLFVQDNGDKKPIVNSDGLGLSNMKMRAEKIRGKLTTGYDKGYWVSLIVA